MQVSIGLLFWILMIIWLVFGFVAWRGIAGPYGLVGNSLLLFILLGLLGWATFGPPLKP